MNRLKAMSALASAAAVGFMGFDPGVEVGRRKYAQEPGRVVRLPGTRRSRLLERQRAHAKRRRATWGMCSWRKS